MSCQCHDVQCHHRSYFRLNNKISITSGGPFIFCALRLIQWRQHTFQWWPNGADCICMSRIRGETVTICSFHKHQRNIRFVICRTRNAWRATGRLRSGAEVNEGAESEIDVFYLNWVFSLTAKERTTTNMFGHFCMICFWTNSAGACKKSVFLFWFFLLLLFWVWFCGFLMIEMVDSGYVEVRNKTTNVCNEKHLTAASWSSVKENWSHLMGQWQTPTYWIWKRDSPKSLNKTVPAEVGLCGC